MSQRICLVLLAFACFQAANGVVMEFQPFQYHKFVCEVKEDKASEGPITSGYTPDNPEL